MLSGDIFSDSSGKSWTTIVHRHPADGGQGIEIFRKAGLKSEHAAETSMESAMKRLKANP